MAISKFIEVFWNQGYDATSINDLQMSIGVKRGSFYAAFSDKESAYLLALDRYIKTVTASRLEVLVQAEDARAGLAAFLRDVGTFLSNNTGRGCLLLTTMAQPPSVTEPTANALSTAWNDLVSSIHASAQAVARQGKFHRSESGNATGDFVVSLILGMNAMARCGQSAEAIRAAAETGAAFLEYQVPAVQESSRVLNGSA